MPGIVPHLTWSLHYGPHGLRGKSPSRSRCGCRRCPCRRNPASRPRSSRGCLVSTSEGQSLAPWSRLRASRRSPARRARTHPSSQLKSTLIALTALPALDFARALAIATVQSLGFPPIFDRIYRWARLRKKPRPPTCIIRDTHTPAGAIESRGHLRGGKINRKALAMAYIRRNGPERFEWRCRHRLGLEVSPRRIPCSLPARLTSAQQIKIEEASGTLKKKSPIPSSGLLASRRVALGQDRASMAILER